MFYDGDIDFHTRVTAHSDPHSERPLEAFYNVYSLPRFCARATELGAAKVAAHDFEITVDIPRGDTNQMGTYTERLADGRRLQISGAVVMSWKVLEISV